jgi:DNA adenine methylase
MRGSIFPYFGGKGLMVAKLLPLFPEHRIYVEAFGGAASLLLAKQPSEIEVYNDLNTGLVEFFRVLRDPEQFAKFQHIINLTPYSRREFYDNAAQWWHAEDPAERAARWFMVARASFSGLFGHSWSFSVSRSSRGMPATVSRYLNAIDSLPEVAARLLRVQIEHRDAFRLFELYDGPQTFFYLDPPYYPDTRRAGQYEHELSAQDHEQMIMVLLTLKAKVLLSGYLCPTYQRLEKAGWTRIDWPVTCGTASGTRTSGNLGVGAARANQRRVESAWLNYAIR